MQTTLDEYQKQVTSLLYAADCIATVYTESNYSQLWVRIKETPSNGTKREFMLAMVAAANTVGTCVCVCFGFQA